MTQKHIELAVAAWGIVMTPLLFVSRLVDNRWWFVKNCMFAAGIVTFLWMIEAWLDWSTS